MYILGINAYHPDSSACLIKDGQLMAAVEEERFLRIKHWAGFPKESINYCLKEAGIGLEDIEYIVLNRDPKANLYKKLIFILLNKPSLSLIKDRFLNIRKIRNIKDTLSKVFLVPNKKLKARTYNIEHHRAHLASSFFVSPFNKAAIVSLDGFGDFTSCMVAKGEDNKIKVLSEVNYPHSLGLFYTAFTQFLGFRNFGDEYKVMGLSGYGQPRYLKEIEEVLVLKPEGRFTLNLDYFSFYKNNQTMEWDNAEPKLPDAFSDKFIEKLGTSRKYEEEISDFHCDLATSVQVIYEKVFFHILNHAYKITGIKNLCFAGGCALNSLANGKIFDNTPFQEIYIQPAASDAGGSLGASYYFYHQILNKKRAFIMKDAYWGPSFSEDEINQELEIKKLGLNGCAIEKIKNDDELCRKAAEFIAQGKILGWFQGKMEFGPRALGNRSILADPRREETKVILNERVKKREWFRPFAPSIILERIGEYSKKDYPEPFMLKVYPIKEEKRKFIPAVTHIDGTGRFQTITKENNLLYWSLIKEFEKITGVPILVNTSFNEHEPIVCKPQEALNCFLSTDMDILIMGRTIIKKRP